MKLDTKCGGGFEEYSVALYLRMGLRNNVLNLFYEIGYKNVMVGLINILLPNVGVGLRNIVLNLFDEIGYKIVMVGLRNVL